MSPKFHPVSFAAAVDILDKTRYKQYFYWPIKRSFSDMLTNKKAEWSTNNPADAFDAYQTLHQQTEPLSKDFPLIVCGGISPS